MQPTTPPPTAPRRENAPTTPLLHSGSDAALAELAFGPLSSRAGSTRSRHLSFLQHDALDLNLEDPAQRAFGDYELIEKIGQGGMGVVYRARQHSLDREVALKLLLAGPWASLDFIERFKREAQSAARMQHPNIVAIYEIGNHEELNFFSMRLVLGPSLASRLAHDPALDAKASARLLRTMAEAVDYAHRLGVLHLDLKPGNVLIDERGEPQIADFGLARRLDDELAGENTEISGTPSYMAPEQAELRSHKLSPATDIYGLGAVLYECLCGRPPFLGADAHDTMKRVINETPVAPSHFDQSVPRDLEAVCLKCLAKDPTERYGSARELADELGRFVEDRPVRVRPLKLHQRVGRWARREPRLAAAVATIAATLVLGMLATTVQWRRADANATVAQANAQESRMHAWAARRAKAFHDTLDGQAFTALPGLYTNLREALAVGDEAQAGRDRLFIGAILANSPRLIDVLGISEPVAGVAISPDATRIAVMGDSWATWLFEAHTGAEIWHAKVFDTPPEPNLDPSAEPPAGLIRFSPDGRYLTLDHRGPDIADAQKRALSGAGMHLLDAVDGHRIAPAEELGADDASYSADGRSAVLFFAQGFLQPYSVADGKPFGPRQVFSPVIPNCILSDDGRHAALLYPGGRVELRDGRTLALRHTVAVPGLENWSFSPDGRRLALTHASEIVLVDTDESPPRERHVATPPLGPALAFSDDGAWLAVGTTLNAPATLLVVDVDAGQVREVASASEGRSDGLFGLLLDRARGYAVGSLANERVALYRLGRDSSDKIESTPGTQLTHPRGTTARAMAAHFGSGLIVTGARDGEARVWRLPRDPVAAAPAPPSLFEQLDFDGTHVPVVRERAVTVVDVGTGAASSTPLVHPQPVQFAQLSADGSVLVTASARELRVWDWRSGRLRFDPWTLPATAVRLLLSHDGSRLVATYGVVDGGAFREMAQSFDLARGTAAGPAVAMPPGNLFGARLNGDGTRLLVWREEQVQVLDAATLRALMPPLRHLDRGRPERVYDARFGADGHTVVTATAVGNFLHHTAVVAYRRWRGTDGRLLERTATATPADTIAVRPDGTGLAAQLGNTDFRGGSMLRFAHAVTGAAAKVAPPFTPAPALEFSADGTRLARLGVANAVITDADTDQPISPLLGVGPRLRDADFLTRMAWRPDALGLLAVSRTHPLYAYWDFHLPTEDVAELGALVALLDSKPRTDAPLAPPLDPGTRALLRRLDPGPPRESEWTGDERPAPPPSRPGGLPPELIDLTPHYNGALAGKPDGVIPAGVQRFDGTDYDVRGLVRLGAQDANGRSYPARIEGIAAPARVAAIRALAIARYWRAPGTPLAWLEYRYRDGGTARIPLAYGTDLRSLYDNAAPGDGAAQPVWVGRDRTGDARIGGEFHTVAIYAPRLVNPHPERDVASLALEANAAPFIAPVFYALSAELAPLPTPVAAGSKGRRP